MSQKRFWDIIDVACRGECFALSPSINEDEWEEDRWYRPLVAEVVKLAPEDIVRFQYWFDDKVDAIYTWRHWGAMVLLNGSQSDNQFYSFQCWLVGMGKATYEAALADPDTLADVVDPDWLRERNEHAYKASIGYVGHDAWLRAGLPEADFHKAYAALGQRERPAISGEEWPLKITSAMLTRRYPRLAALLCGKTPSRRSPRPRPLDVEDFMDRTNEAPSKGSVSRRGFLVTIGGAVLGSYFLPFVPTAAETAASAPATAPTAEAVRRILSKPTMTKMTQGGYFLTWIEITETGGEVMYWHPETEKELAEAKRFYEDARDFDPQAPKRRAAPVRKIGARQKALIAAVLDKLDDDAPRLAYADWLHAQGSSQGEFVRLWCVTDRMGESHPRLPAMMERWEALLERDGKKWVEPLTALGLRNEWFGRFDPRPWLQPKGLTEEIEIYKPGILPEQAEQLFAAAPLLHKINLTYNLPDVAGIAALPQMAQVTSLKLGMVGLTLKHLRALASSPHMKRLKELDISHNEFGPQAGPLLADSTVLTELHTLNLAHCYLRFAGVAALASSPKSAGLATLDLTSNQLGPRSLGALAASPHLGRLTSLNFEWNRVSVAGIRSLRSAAFLGTLTALNLNSCKLNPEAAAALTALPLTALTALDLGINEISAAGVRWLAASPHLARLRELDLSSNNLKDAGAAALASAFHFAALRDLNLYSNRIGDRGLTALVSASHFSALVNLNLSNNRIGDRGLIALASSPHFQGLKELRLNKNHFGPTGAKAFAASPHFRKLTKLEWCENNIGADGAQALAASPYLTELEELSVTGPAVGKAGEDALRKRFGRALQVRD